MQRRAVVFGSSAIVGAILVGCGGGGDDTTNVVTPAWEKGGSIALGTNTTITMDLSRGHVSGLVTTKPDPSDPKKVLDDPTRVILPDEVKEIVFVSAILGSKETSPARAAMTESGVVHIPNTISADGTGYFFVILKSGETFPFSIGKDASSWALSGAPGIIVNQDGAIQYGDYRLGWMAFPNANTLRIHFGSDVLGGLSTMVDPSVVHSVQWISERTRWQDSMVRSLSLQRDAKGDYFVDVLGVPNNDRRAYLQVMLKDGTRVDFNVKSPRWEKLDGLTVVTSADGKDTSLSRGTYRSGKISFVAPKTLRVHFGADVLGGLGKAVLPANVSYIRWFSDLTGSEKGTVRSGALQIDQNGDYYADIVEMPNNDRGYLQVILTAPLADGTTVVDVDTRSPHWEKDTGDIALL